MIDTIILSIYLAGVVQALCLIAALQRARLRNKRALRFLLALIVVMTIFLLEEFADAAGVSAELALGLALELALAPLLYFFTRLVIAPEAAVRRRDFFHFAPVAFAIFLLALVHAGNRSGSLGIANPQYGQWIVAWVVLKAAYFAGYAVMMETALRNSLRDARGRRAANLGVLRRWLWASFAAAGLCYAVFFLCAAGAPMWRDSDTVAGFVMFAVIFSIGYLALSHRDLFDALPVAQCAPGPQAVADAARLRDFIAAQRPHRDPDFSIERLASGSGVSVPAARAAVEILSGGAFAVFLNGLRLEEFESLARDPANRSKTTLELAYAAGFNSKATFYRVFNAGKGVTPGAFREKIEFTPEKASHAGF